MQLDLFGEPVAAPVGPSFDDPALLPDDISGCIADLEFGPVLDIEAKYDVKLDDVTKKDSTGRMLGSLIDRDVYESMKRSGRLERLLQEVMADKQSSTSTLSTDRTMAMQPHFIPIILDRLNGASIPSLAVKYNRAASTIYQTLNRPGTRAYVAKLLTEYASQLGNIEERIRFAASEAVDTLVDIMRNGKEENRQKSAFGLLRMGGYDASAYIAAQEVIPQAQADSAIAESANKLFSALQESARVRSRGYDMYTEVPQAAASSSEAEYVEPPKGIRKIAAG